MKKGFTLIELLAVIVILAIIALIAVPIVLNIVNDAKESAQLRSAEMYIDGVEQAVMRENMDTNADFNPTSCNINSDGDLGCEGYLEPIEVEVDGEKPTGGNINFENGKINEVNLSFGNGKLIIKTDEGKLVYGLVLNDLCDFKSGTENTIGAKYSCDFGAGKRMFYILELGSDPVTNSILKSNEVALILEGNYDTTTQKWCNQGANILCNADGLTSKLDEIALSWKKLKRDQIVLPNLEQITAAAGGNDIDSSENAWLHNWPEKPDYGDWVPFGYWTSTPVEPEYVAIIEHMGHMDEETGEIYYIGSIQYYDPENGDYGVRPVVILNK